MNFNLQLQDFIPVISFNKAHSARVVPQREIILYREWKDFMQKMSQQKVELIQLAERVHGLHE
ncbi:hypothetical protein SS50377_28543 [Spironucleus salmonicida]|uniref:Uncharacterized protein n=1 Tax=Spironucleus salmonicida TaxID=348837 RepID=A0A9P8LK90_9EUKA|nr:hypothetical protein SS50377_28543 [Spironucleus salmonicida]